MVCAIARCTCHVQLIGPQLASLSFRRSDASNEYSPVPIGPAVQAPEAKMVAQTYTHTYIHTFRHWLDYFFSSNPPEDIFDHQVYNANALEPLYSNDFELEAGNLALCQNRKFIPIPLYAFGGIRNLDPSKIDKAILPSSVRFERPNRFSRSGAKPETIKAIFTCPLHV